MNIKDTIQLIGNELYTFFGASGSRQTATMLDLSRGASLELDELKLVAMVDGRRVILEEFAAAPTARNAFEAVRSAMAKRQRVRRATAIGRGLAKYVVAPFGLVLFGLAMNVAVHGGSQAAPAVAAYRAPSTYPAAAPYSPMPNAAAAPATLQLAAPPERIAAALESGVQAGKFTVKIGNAKGTPIYTFEDPLCTHCQEMAPELAKLAKSHAVYVFPVSVIGGDDSVKAAATALCTKDRAKGWELAQSGASTVSVDGKQPDATALKACTDEVNANNAIFRALGLRYTPTVFSAKGELFPSNSPATAEAIEKWLTTEG
jgi:TrbB protein